MILGKIMMIPRILGGGGGDLWEGKGFGIGENVETENLA